MATLTGKNLLNSIIESTGVEINTLIFNALSAKLQQMIDNDTAADLAVGIAMSGFSTVINDATEMGDLINAVATNKALIADAAEGAVGEIEFPPMFETPPAMTERSIDGTSVHDSPETIDAGSGSFKFIDDALINTNVLISNFSSDDGINVRNAEIGDYSFLTNGQDVVISSNPSENDNNKIINSITLLGIIDDIEAMIHDQSSFISATGFDPFIS